MGNLRAWAEWCQAGVWSGLTVTGVRLLSTALQTVPAVLTVISRPVPRRRFAALPSLSYSCSRPLLDIFLRERDTAPIRALADLTCSGKGPKMGKSWESWACLEGVDSIHRDSPPSASISNRSCPVPLSSASQTLLGKGEVLGSQSAGNS